MDNSKTIEDYSMVGVSGIPADAKYRINSLLFELLPPTATLGELKLLANQIYNDIDEMWGGSDRSDIRDAGVGGVGSGVARRG